MTEDPLQSSDSVRTAAPLKHVQCVTLGEPLVLESGQRLEQVRLAYETYGTLNDARDNAVLICHALSGDSHVAMHDEQDDPGWWDIAIGPGKPLDTDRYFVICSNILGGCRGTTGPNTLDPRTGRPYGPDFPFVTIGDMVNAQARLLDHLGIESLRGVIGGSMGGMQVLQWAIAHPHRVRKAIALATAPHLTSQGLAFDVIGRNAITSDPSYRDGNYYDYRGSSNGIFSPASPVVGLAIARMIGHITYLSREAMKEKFGRAQPREIASDFEKDSSVATYLAHQGDKFVERFDANSYLVISRAMDRFDLGDGERLARSLAASTCRWLVVSFTTDWLFPPDQSQDMVRALLANRQAVSYCNIRSGCGHDAFLLPDELETYGGLVAGFLAADGPSPQQCEPDEAPQPDGHHDTSIFHGRRLDYDLLERLIKTEIGSDNPSVLDLGCGGGQLLLRLRRQNWTRLLGVEIDQQAVLATVQRGLDCVHQDLNDGLAQFADKQFDCVLLSRTLQTVYNVDRVVDDMLRVGRKCIVSFPNFAYGPLRAMLAGEGKAPSAGLLRYTWYNTPNIRFFSLRDFEDYCREKGARIHRCVALNTETRQEVADDPNHNADLAVFVISRDP